MGEYQMNHILSEESLCPLLRRIDELTIIITIAKTFRICAERHKFLHFLRFFLLLFLFFLLLIIPNAVRIMSTYVLCFLHIR